MAKASVTLKVTPLELQVIDEALRNLAMLARDPGEKHRINYSLSNGVPLQLVAAVNKLRQDLGVK